MPQPVLRYNGGKRALAEQIIAHFPPLDSFTHYEERFAGGAAVFFALRARGWQGTALLSDLNADLIAMYRGIRDDVERVIALYGALRDRYLALAHDGRRDFYLALREGLNAVDDEPDDLRAARVLFLSATNFNGLQRVNSSGDYNAPWGRDTVQPPDKAEVLRVASRALRNVTLQVAAFEDMVVEPGAVIYCDPPYVGGFVDYTKHGFSPGAQKRLAEWAAFAAAADAHVVLSNADHPDVRTLYAGWNFTKIMARRAINRDADGRGPVGELIIHKRTT